MSSHVGTIVIGDFLPEKEAIAEDLMDNLVKCHGF
jgi:hypothetical protein